MNKIYKVLIVDDDEDDQDIFCEAVGEINKSITCIRAINGEDALYNLSLDNDSLPDLIFLDLNMPRLDGKQFLKEIKKLDNARHVPVIIYSTSNLKADKEETKQLGAADFLNKPTEFKVLCYQLQDLFSKHSA